MARVGVFLCDCGPNIAERLDLEAMQQQSANLDGVVYCGRHPLLCSQGGKDYLVQQIRENELERVIFAGCSPREHEHTFMEVMENAGLNPYLMQVVNIREQCTWVHEDKREATGKSMALIRAGVRRVLQHEPLEHQWMDAESAVLVIGAGVAGIEAALVAAQTNRKVYVVEKTPCVGGHANRYEEVFPVMECGSCMLEPKLDDLLHHDNIEVLTYSEVTEVLGFYGNFKVKVSSKARYVDPSACFGCDECMTACPVKGIPDEYTENLKNRSAIYIPYPGALPNVAVIDRDHCLRLKGEECSACAEACPFAAVDFSQQDEERELSVGAIVLATGFDTFDPTPIQNLGYGRIPEIYTGLEFETLLSSGGPTEGEIRMKNGQTPGSIAFVHCVGSKSDEHHAYCSGACCMYTLKFAHLAHKKLPDAKIVDIHSNLSIAGKGYFGLFKKVTDEGVNYLRTSAPNEIEISQENGQCVLTIPDGEGGREVRADMVVLSTAMVASEDTRRLADMLEVTLDEFGYVREGHGRLAAVSTNIEGVFAAGGARAPGDIQAAVLQGAAASGKILTALIPGQRIKLETRVAWTDPDLCCGCRMCISVCPYKAVSFDEEKQVSVVNQALCRGCGTCVAACASDAIAGRHFESPQIMAELEGLLK
jgi:heterodisulfide reductase subunit A2